MMQQKQNNSGGFTIVEVLLVLVVLSILAVLAINTLSSARVKARNSTRITDMRSVASQLEAYHSRNGAYPSEEQAIVFSNFPGLSIEAVTDPDGDVLNTGGDYTYAGEDCVTDVSCEGFELRAAMEDADDYVVDGINNP